MPNFRSAGAEIFDSEKGIGRKENRAAGAKKRPSVIAGLIFLTSYSALSRISRDPRVKPEDDKEKNALSFERAGSNYSLVIWDIFSLMTAGVYFSTLLSTLREASFSLTLLLSSSPESSSRIRA